MPNISAEIKGNYLAPKLSGIVDFIPWNDGTMVRVEVANLPINETPNPNIFAFHIHDGNSCGDKNTKFESAMGHYNPSNKAHPLHVGDMPSLFGNNGYTFMSFYTNRFKPEDVVNRTVIIHSNYDDYTSQPAGNSGDRIACGVITKK